MTQADPERARGLTIGIARRARFLRRAHEWTGEQLGDAMRGEGFDRWDRGVVAHVENGRRRSLTIDEWLGLSKCLGIPALDLLIPDGEPFRVTPTSAPMSPDEARRWVVEGSTGQVIEKTGGATARLVFGGSKVVQNIYRDGD